MTEYEVIIIGAGPAGLSCALKLSKHKKHVLVLEKRKEVRGKVCGDGLTENAILALKEIGVNPFSLGGKKVLCCRFVEPDNIIENNCKLLGLSRDILDAHLLMRAREAGAIVLLNHPCKEIERKYGRYYINGMYVTEKVVLACGAMGSAYEGMKTREKLPVGISARVVGGSYLADDAFWFFRNSKYRGGYAWAFPVGEQTWNIGVWSSYPDNLKALYGVFEKETMKCIVSYDRKPKGALIGASDKSFMSFLLPRIGDCAYSANAVTGEGISFAVGDGIKMAERLLGV